MFDPQLERYDTAYGKRPEFGELVRESGRRLYERESALLDGAVNLLTKALARLDAGETEAAGRLVARVAAMPYDERYEGSPGVRGAAQIVYNLVSDELEMSDPDDATWLTVAVDVHAGLDGAGRVDLESVLHGFVLQSDFFTLGHHEQRIIREKFGHAPLEADLGDGPDMTADDRIVVISSLLQAERALRTAYDLLA